MIQENKSVECTTGKYEKKMLFSGSNNNKVEGFSEYFFLWGKENDWNDEKWKTATKEVEE